MGSIPAFPPFTGEVAKWYRQTAIELLKTTSYHSRNASILRHAIDRELQAKLRIVGSNPASATDGRVA